jgi:peptidoglycan/LPS O-acetylase OafA/YrhL
LKEREVLVQESELPLDQALEGEISLPDHRKSLGQLLTRSRLPALDGLRALSVFAVIASHVGLPIPGDLGVVCFFVLSGFLITWLLLKEAEKHGSFSLKAFYARRALRIVPAYGFFVLVSALYFLHKNGFWWDKSLTLTAMTYTVNYYNVLHHHMTTPLSHTWSLSVEEQFYLLWPLSLLFLMKGGRRRIVFGLASAILCVCLWRTYAFNVLHSGTAYVYDSFETRLDSLAIGCLLALCASTGRLDRVSLRATRYEWFPFLTLLLLYVSRTRGDAYHYGPGFTVDSVLLAVFIVQALLLVETRAWSWLDYPAVRYLGIISYPIYLYHGYGTTVSEKFSSYPMTVRFLAAILVSVLLATGSFYCIERPFLKLKKRYERR